MSDTRWLWREVTEYVREILPIEDSREHWLLDECWCEPTTEHIQQNVMCDDGIVRGLLLISHNAHDKRKTMKEMLHEADRSD